MNAAIYCRVSTNKQELANQLDALKSFARKHVFCDVASGKRVDRTEFNKMLGAAEVDTVGELVSMNGVRSASRNRLTMLDYTDCRVYAT